MILHSWEEILKVLTSERTDRKVPRVASNPYGDNTIGMAFDEGWWAAMRVVKERWTELRKESEL